MRYKLLAVLFALSIFAGCITEQKFTLADTTTSSENIAGETRPTTIEYFDVAGEEVQYYVWYFDIDNAGKALFFLEYESVLKEVEIDGEIAYDASSSEGTLSAVMWEKPGKIYVAMASSGAPSKEILHDLYSFYTG